MCMGIIFVFKTGKTGLVVGGLGWVDPCDAGPFLSNWLKG